MKSGGAQPTGAGGAPPRSIWPGRPPASVASLRSASGRPGQIETLAPRSLLHYNIKQPLEALPELT